MTVHSCFKKSRRSTMPVPHKRRKSFPAAWFAHIFGFHDSIQTASKKLSNEHVVKCWIRTAFTVFRRQALLFYLGICSIWAILFTTNVYSYEVSLFERERASGREKEANIIIHMLDNLPVACNLLRNLVVVGIFYRRYPRMQELTDLLSTLLLAFDSSSQSFTNVVTWAKKMARISCVIVLVNFLMLVMYFFTADFEDIFKTWNSDPFPVHLIGWQVVTCMTIFTVPNFIVSQIIIGSIVGFAAGALELLRHLNKNLHKLGPSQEDHQHQKDHDLQFVLSMSGIEGIDERHHAETGKYETLLSLRLMHFRTVQYVNAVTDAFSEILLVVVATDFASAVGYVGLLIGRPSSSVFTSFYFNRVYHAVATVTWMGFYLCGQYWPLILLPEESERTFHHIQCITFSSGKVKAEKWDRELMHFLLATKDNHIGIVAGKLFYFSRHLSVTMITLLCSYGVLVYELLHRGAADPAHIGGEAAQIQQPRISDILTMDTNFTITAAPLFSLSQQLQEAIAFYVNVTLGAPKHQL